MINTQPIRYQDAQAEQASYRRLQHLPGLVSPGSLEMLQQQLAEVAQGKRMILHAGECAEQFSQCHFAGVGGQWRVLAQLTHLFESATQQPVTLIARLAGQYAKPRSQLEQSVNGVSLPAYRGDLINGVAFDPQQRQPDPARLLQGYDCAQRTWRWLRRFDEVSNQVSFISHECLHLGYAHALTRNDAGGAYYAATHLPWVGMRCLLPNSTQLAYVRTIRNPIGLKLGPGLDKAWLRELLLTLNPQRQPGRLVLIHRLGCRHIQQELPQLFAAVAASQVPVVWVHDPLHGNTCRDFSGQKQRYMGAIMREWQQAQRLHLQHGVPLAGIHLELTPERVFECGGQPATSVVDPRLNGAQAAQLLGNVIG